MPDPDRAAGGSVGDRLYTHPTSQKLQKETSGPSDPDRAANRVAERIYNHPTSRKLQAETTGPAAGDAPIHVRGDTRSLGERLFDHPTSRRLQQETTQPPGAPDLSSPSAFNRDTSNPQDDAPAPRSSAPATYALSLPRGGRLDESDLQTFEAIAREADWTQEEAATYLAQEVQLLDDRAAHFAEETRADKDYGGHKLAEVQRRVNRILDRYRPAGTPRGDALRGVLKKTGYEHNIHFVSLIADMANDLER